MNIANNILKSSLQNVYFLTGTPLAGKTTMCKKIAEKHGFVWFDENYNGEPFKKWKSICEEKYQPLTIERNEKFRKKGHYDWDAHFNRSAEDIASENSKRNQNDEFIEFVMIELIKLSLNNKVITDVCLPINTLVEISDYSRIACLLTMPELVTTINYGSRDDHKSYLEWIMSLSDPEKKITKNDEVFSIEVSKTFDEVRKYNLFSTIRTNDSSIENTLVLLEAHFNL